MKNLMLIFVIVIIYTFGDNWRYGYAEDNASQDTEVTALVKTTPIEKHTLTDSIDCYGTVAPDTIGLTAISTPGAVRVAEIFVASGQAVKKGDNLVRLSSEPDGNAAYAQAKSTLDYAVSEQSRIDVLLEQHLATNSQRDAAEKAVIDAKAALEAQKKLGNGDDKQIITAPFDGVITSIGVSNGDRLPAGTTIMQISSKDALRARLEVEPGNGRHINPGMKVLLKSVFNSDISIEGSITKIQSMIDPVSRMISVLAEFDAKDSKLISGDNVRGRIILSSAEVYAVPREAVLSNDNGSYIFQVKNGKAKRVYIKTGLTNKKFIGIEGDFKPEYRVVVSGNYELEDGMTIREETAQ